MIENGTAGATGADTRAPKAGETERHGMKPVAVVFAIANAAVLAVFVGLLATGWVEFGSTAVAATAG